MNRIQIGFPRSSTPALAARLYVALWARFHDRRITLSQPNRGTFRVQITAQDSDALEYDFNIVCDDVESVAFENILASTLRSERWQVDQRPRSLLGLPIVCQEF